MCVEPPRPHQHTRHARTMARTSPSVHGLAREGRGAPGVRRGRRKRSTPHHVPPRETGREDELGGRPVAPGIRVFPTRSNPNRLFAAERERAGFVGNTGSSGRLFSAETGEPLKPVGMRGGGWARTELLVRLWVGWTIWSSLS